MITTNRLILRKYVKEDYKAIFENWATDEDVTKYLTWLPHKNTDETKEILSKWIEEYKNPKTQRFAIILKENKDLIGMIDIAYYRDNIPYIGYLLSKKYWNNGYITEALKSFINYLFNKNFDTLMIEANEKNIGSNKVIEKCGFKLAKKITMPCSDVRPEIVTKNVYVINS